MSQENVEIVQAFFDAWNAGDMDAVRELYDPDVMWRAAEGWPEPGPYIGREAVMRFIGQLKETWDDDALEPIRFIDGADRIVVRFIWRGVGYGPEASMEFTGVFTVRKGRIFGVEFFWDHAEALETLGLSDQETHSDSPSSLRDAASARDEENLDVMRRWFDTWNRADLDAFADLFDADAELITDPSWVEAGPFKGQAAIRDWYEGLKESYEREAVVLRELFEVADKVVARLDWQVRGRTSGIESDLDATSVNTIRRGKIVRQQWYFDHAEALEAVGLSEQDVHSES